MSERSLRVAVIGTTDPGLREQLRPEDVAACDDRGIPASWPCPFSRFREEMTAPDLAAYDLRP